MRTGIATVPLDYGKCPRWLFERMKRLSRGIFLAIREEFGPEEILKRLSDPVWFQSLGCVIGFDFNSSGLTTTTLGALKAGLFDIQDELGIYVCGGKRESRKTPQEIETYSISRGFPFSKELSYSSRMAAKIDSSCLQDGHQIYHHNFLFTKSGQWVVIQQGMNVNNQTARRYHWLSSNVKDFVEEPHSGIISQGAKLNPLNLIAKESRDNKKISFSLAKEDSKRFLRDLNLVQSKDFYWHPVVNEKFDLKRLKKTIFFAKIQEPKNFEQLLSLKGIGPKTIRALSLVSELIYGVKPSYEDPARYSFTVGGKDHVPMPVDRKVYDAILDIMERGVKKTKIGIKEKELAIKRLRNFQKYE